VGGTCGTHRGGERCLRGPKARDHWEDLCVDGRITLRTLVIGIDEANWIQLAHDRVQ
jgi:hypothetical protein